MSDIPIRDRLLDAALPHVAFEGWSAATFDAAVADAGVDPGLAHAHYPRGAVDLALACHARGDRAMLDRIETTDMSDWRFRDKVAFSVRARLEAAGDREVVRRAAALFALPQHAADGARAIWGTADAIWTALGDTSNDVNWYTKRASLSAVYSATLLYWLGDDSPDHAATWDFLGRRIENVMQFEALKAKVRSKPALKPLLAGSEWLLARIKAPARRGDLPGTLRQDR